MGKHSYIGAIAKAGSYAFLLGALAFPATVVSQTDNANSNPEFMPPIQQPPMMYRPGGYGMVPPQWRAQDNVASMPSPKTGEPAPAPMGESMGKAMDGFMNQMQQAGGYGSGYGMGMPGMGPKSYGQSSAQNPGTMGWGNPAMAPNAGNGMFSGCSGSGYGCGQKHFRGHGGRGHPAMGRRGMRLGATVLELLHIPDLSDEQREKLYTILDKLRRDHWKLMGENMDHASELRGLYAKEPLDAKAIGAVYSKIFDVKQKMIENAIEAKQQGLNVLTDEQRNQFKTRGKPAQAQAR